MGKYKIIYKNGKTIIVEAKTTLELVKKYDLAGRSNVETKIIRLS